MDEPEKETRVAFVSTPVVPSKTLITGELNTSHMDLAGIVEGPDAHQLT